jgi:hypothetical protein
MLTKAEPCLVAASPMLTLADKVRAFITIADLKAKEGLTVAEFGELFLALMRLCIEAAEVLDAAGPQKKEMVLEALGMLFDAVADKAIPTYSWPLWILFKPAVRSALLAAASGGIEVVLQLVRK